MKRRFTAFLTSLLCMTGTVLSLPVSAERRIENGRLVVVDEDVNEGLTMPEETDHVYIPPEIKYIFTTDTFSYGLSDLKSLSGFQLKTELEGLENMRFMVVGETSYSYYVCTINQNPGGFGMMQKQDVKDQLGDIELHVGDILAETGMIITALPEVTIYVPWEENAIAYLGNGVDIFGEAFEKVIRMQLVVEQEELGYDNIYGIELVKGDVNVDDEISILDCLAINRNLLIGEPLCDYAQLAGDINENGVIDAVDSLSILKECINITENFE